MNLHGRSLLKEIDLTAEEFLYLVDLGSAAAAARSAWASGASRLAGRNIALIFEKTSTRTRSAFEVAAHDEGAHVTYLGPGNPSSATRNRSRTPPGCWAGCSTASSTAGSPRTRWRRSAQYAGVPVWNGLTDDWHPTQMLADILTMRDHARQAAGRGHLLLPRRRPEQHGELAAGHRRAARHGRPDLRPRAAAAVRPGAGDRPRRSPPAPAPGSTVTADVAGGGRGCRLPVHRRLAVDGRAGRASGTSGSTCCCPTR